MTGTADGVAGWFGITCAAFVSSDFDGDTTEFATFTLYDANGMPLSRVVKRLGPQLDEWHSINVGMASI